MNRFKKLGIIIIATAVTLTGVSYGAYTYASSISQPKQIEENIVEEQPSQEVQKKEEPRQEVKQDDTKQEQTEEEQVKEQHKQEEEKEQLKKEIKEEKTQAQIEKENQEKKEQEEVQRQQEQARQKEREQQRKAEQERKAQEEKARQERMVSIYNHPCNNIDNRIGVLGGVDCQQAIAMTPSVVNLTKQVVGDTSDPSEQARKIYNWIISNISYNQSYDNSIKDSYGDGCNPDVVIARGNTICYGYSNLFTAMCRVVGLPTQMIYGTYHSVDGNWKPHCWNKVLVNGNWIKVDPTIGRLYNCYGTGNFDNRHREDRVIISAS